MKARLKKLMDSKQEEDKKDAKQLLLSSYNFKKSSAPPQSSQEVWGFVTWPHLSLESKHDLIFVNKRFYGLFQKPFYIEKLLHHVAYGEYKNTKAMIEKNRELLVQKGTVEIRHRGLKFKDKTALQIALHLKDTEIVELCQCHMDLADIQTQQNAQLPKDFKTEDAKKIKEGHKILEEIFADILEAKVSLDNQDNLLLDEKATSAISRLGAYLKPKADQTETGQDITDALLLKTFELSDAYYDRFSIPAQNLTYDSPKNKLAWRQIAGGVEVQLPFPIIQAMSAGVYNTIQKMEKGELQGRTLTFEIWNGKKWTPATFPSMVSNPSSGLGVKYAIWVGGVGAVAGVAARPGWGRPGLFKTYVNQKTASLQNLYNTRDDERSVKRKFVG